MNEWMNGWMNGWMYMDEQRMDKWIFGYMDGRLNKWM